MMFRSQVFVVSVLAVSVHLTGAGDVTVPSQATAGSAAVLDDMRFTRQSAIRYVDDTAVGSNNGTSWCNAYTDLQAALLAAGAGDEVRVAQGRYTPAPSGPNPDRSRSFVLKNRVVMRGGFAGCGASDPNAYDPELHVTTLTGDLMNDDGPFFANTEDNSYHVVVTHGTDFEAVIDGFTIEGGNSGNSGDGGGVWNIGGGPTLTHCRIQRNQALNGGGLASRPGSRTAFPVIDRCTFSGNAASGSGGGMYNDGCGALLFETAFDGNSAQNHGGGLARLGAGSLDLFLRSCEFKYNNAQDKGGAIFLRGPHGSFTPWIIATRFEANTAKTGGALFSISDLRIYNSAFVFNSAGYGGAVAVSCLICPGPGSCPCPYDVLFFGSLFARNRAVGSGGAILYTGSPSTRISSCTIAGNIAEQGGGVWERVVLAGLPVRNSVLWGNLDNCSGGDENCMHCQCNLAAQWARSEDGLPNAGSCTIQGWTGSEMGNSPSDPLFEDPMGTDEDVENDFKPRRISPVIDSGRNADVPEDEADLDGDGNLEESAPVDLLGHPRLVDEPSVQDCEAPGLQCGTSPIIDRGAIEFYIPCTTGTDCDSSDFCTVGTCGADSHICTWGQRDCDDGNDCTYDSCNEPSSACTHTFQDPDYDFDGDVDLVDFVQLQKCVGFDKCGCIDLVEDNQMDLAYYGWFQINFGRGSALAEP